MDSVPDLWEIGIRVLALIKVRQSSLLYVRVGHRVRTRICVLFV